MDQETQKKSKKGIIILIAAVVLTVPWNIFLESLKADNPQLSTSILVRGIPLLLGLVIFSGSKPKKKTEQE